MLYLLPELKILLSTAPAIVADGIFTCFLMNLLTVQTFELNSLSFLLSMILG